MHIRPFQAVCPNLNYITSPDSFFKTVKEDYPEYKQSGFFNKSGVEGFFIYQIEKASRSYLGIIACAEVNDFIDGRIKKHENTLPEKEQQQLHLLLHRNAMVKPILLCYEKVEEIERFIQTQIQEKPFMELFFELEQEAHRLWSVTDGALVQELQQLFDEKISKAYIADGHHRASTMSLMHQRSLNSEQMKSYDSVLTAFFPTTELEILEFNRIVNGLNDLSPTHFMARLSQVADIQILDEPGLPASPRELVMFMNKEWYRLNWKTSILEKYKEEKVLLDVSILNHEILEDIIGITNVRTDERLRYIEGPKSMDAFREKVLKDDHRIGFLLYPIQMESFLQIADDGKVLPPKSTWFEPRMRNGIIAQEF